MRSPIRVSFVLLILYAAFFGWYTSFRGPLSAREIERYAGLLAESGAEPERLALWRRFMETDTGGDFAMLNVIEMRDVPLPVDGVGAGESSSDVLRRYAEPFLAQALKSAAHPVLLGTAAAGALDLWGIEGAEHWSSGGLVRYRSRRDLMEQVVRAQEAGIHDFKLAAMSKTIAFPLDPWFHLGDPRLVLGLLLLSLGLAWSRSAASGRGSMRGAAASREAG